MAAELLGGALLSTFVQITIDNLASRFKDYFRGKKLNKELLSKLKKKLQRIDALADDAELKQFTDSHVRAWLLQAKDVVFDAEDLLSEIDVELSKCQVEAESKTIVGQVTSLLKSSSISSFENEMERMKQILVDIEDLLSQSDDLGLKRNSAVGVGSGSGSNESWKLSSTSLPSETDIYGRDDDKENIIKWLTSHSDNKLSILSIVGMGGLGKTTLAQLVYNDSKIEGKFDIKAWVCVSNDFDVLKISRTILERITGSTDDSRDLEMVHTRLKQNLSGKKFLLVLDDVWNEKWHKWEEVQKPLVAFGAEGSRILITTRSNEVASTVRSKKHSLKELQEDHCWQLFAEHAFPGDNLQRSSYYKEIGMKIVEKCKGLPLALKSMGTLLRNKSSVSKWQSMLESEVWQIKDNNIVPTLALSYLHLPPHLRRCFAYCALFPKDYVFDKKGLIQLWMCENFLLCHEQYRSPENVGEEMFSDLLSRSFFQKSSGFPVGFVMHDLLNDLAKFVCGDICFRLGVDRAKRIPKTTRHFSFSTRETKDFDGLGSLYDGERLHTFMPSDRGTNYVSYGTCWQFKVPINDLLSKFKFLRVLSLSGCDKLTEVPQSVGNLKHLCSLELSATFIEKLPESTCSLSNLQILKLGKCRNLKQLPSNLHKLTHLCYFDLSNTGIDKLPESLCLLFNMQILKLNNCLHLKELPPNLHMLTSLQRLEFINTRISKVPPHLGKLKNLQVCMSWFDVGKSREFTIQQLGELNVVGGLSIENLQNIENPSDASAMGLKNKTHLVELKLDWGQKWRLRNMNLDDSLKEREETVIENLQPSKQLKQLSIRNYGGTKFPSWLFDNSLSNVVSLKLYNCQSFQRLPSLGLLIFLKELEIEKLDGIVSIDADFYGSELFSFTSLETLKFDDMKEWERWECEGVTGAFPRLQHLSVRNCPKLKGDLPVLHLKELFIYHCEQLETCAPETLKLTLVESGKLQFNWATLKHLKMRGHNIEAQLVEMIEHKRNDTFEFLDISKWTTVKRSDCRNSKTSDGSLKTFPLDFFPKLESLTVTGFSDLQMITVEHAHNHLMNLIISHCPRLESLPERMDILLSSLENLEIYNCPKVQIDRGKLQFDWTKIKSLRMAGHNMEASLVEMIGHNRNNTCLEELNICYCSVWSICSGCRNRETSDGSLETFPLHFFPKLKSLNFRGFPGLQMFSVEHVHNHIKTLSINESPQLVSLPERMNILLSSLRKLTINGCPRVEWVPGEYLPSTLKWMILHNCSKLMVSLKGAFGTNPSLEYLTVGNMDVESFFDEGLLPPSLTHLSIWNCRSLKNVEYKGLCHLSSLERLYLRKCPKLKCLPEEGLPKSISYVEIVGCPLLKQRCEELTGEDWAKIAHIHELNIR